MTLEDLLECDAETLEKMTDDELLKHFQQYLVVTRPDQAKANRTTKTKEDTRPLVYISPGKRAAIEKAKEMGIDLDFMFKRRKK